MKTKQEQIEEIAQEICGAKDSDICQNGCSKACFVWKYAERAYSAGYRKASDMIDEFVERLKQDEESVKIGNEWKAVVRDVDIERIAAEMRQEVEK